MLTLKNKRQAEAATLSLPRLAAAAAAGQSERYSNLCWQRVAATCKLQQHPQLMIPKCKMSCAVSLQIMISPPLFSSFFLPLLPSLTPSLTLPAFAISLQLGRETERIKKSRQLIKPDTSAEQTPAGNNNNISSNNYNS